MDYEKLYKDALERARVLSKSDNSTVIYETIFPELKKKTNEQIIDALIECHALGAKYSQKTCGIPDKEILAWLEKQKKLYEEVNTKDFEEFINHISAQFSEISFAKISRIAVRVKNYIDIQNEVKQI